MVVVIKDPLLAVDDIKALFTKHNMSIPDSRGQIGFYAYHNGEIIGAGFVRGMDGGQYAMIDGYITNPDQPGELRNRALDLITYKILRTMKHFNLNCLTCFTIEPTIIERAKRFGFKIQPHTLLSISL